MISNDVEKKPREMPASQLVYCGDRTCRCFYVTCCPQHNAEVIDVTKSIGEKGYVGTGRMCE